MHSACTTEEKTTKRMQQTEAYKSVQLNKLSSEEVIYETPESKKTSGKCKFGFLALISIIALVLALIGLIIYVTHVIIVSTRPSQDQKVTQQDIQAAINNSIQSSIVNLTQEIQNLKAFQGQVETRNFVVQSLIVNFTDDIAELSDIVAFQADELDTLFTVVEDIQDTINEVSDQCGGKGWRRVAFINMSDPNQECPQQLDLTTFSIRSCGRARTETHCSSVNFTVSDPPYSRVCGRAEAYQFGHNNAFFGYHDRNQDIDGYYVDGLSITHGSPRTHIWTLASGAFNGTIGDQHSKYRCPCDEGNSWSSPPFIGNDYFCDSAAARDNYLAIPSQLYPENTLWDGEDCQGTNPCCRLNNPPWFEKMLPRLTSDDIELRLCFWSERSHSYANIALTHLELYVS